MVRYFLVSIGLFLGMPLYGMVKDVHKVSVSHEQKQLTHKEIDNFITVIHTCCGVESGNYCAQMMASESYEVISNYIMIDRQDIADSVQKVLAYFNKYNSCSFAQKVCLEFCRAITNKMSDDVKKFTKAHEKMSEHDPVRDGIFELEL